MLSPGEVPSKYFCATGTEEAVPVAHSGHADESILSICSRVGNADDHSLVRYCGFMVEYQKRSEPNGKAFYDSKLRLCVDFDGYRDCTVHIASDTVGIFTHWCAAISIPCIHLSGIIPPTTHQGS